MDLVGGNMYAYLPSFGILYKKKDRSKEAGPSIGHEIGHMKLKHVATTEPWERFLQELEAWEYILVRGAEVEEKFVRSKLVPYTGSIFRTLGKEEGMKALALVDEMLDRYYGEE